MKVMKVLTEGGSIVDSLKFCDKTSPQFRRYTELKHCRKNTIPYGVIKGSLIVAKKMLCVDLFFVGLFQGLTYCEDLVDGGLAWSETALIRSNQCFDEWL